MSKSKTSTELVTVAAPASPSAEVAPPDPLAHFNSLIALGLNALNKTVPDAAKPAPLRQTQTLLNLTGQWAARNASNTTVSAGVLPLAMDSQTWQELLAMQAAVVQRLQQQQKSWVEGLNGLVLEYSQIKQANTMSKFAEQHFNLIAQFGQLVSLQTTALMGLQENIEVDYGYWAAQKVQEKKPALALIK